MGGGCRGRQLAARLGEDGHIVRITTRTEAGREAIEAVGAECWIATPDRIATLRPALAQVTLLCWLLGTAAGEGEQVEALHGSRLDFMLTQAIDTTVRGILYEAAGTIDPRAIEAGAASVRAAGERNSIPHRLLTVDPREGDAWQAAALEAIESLLGAGRG